MMTTIKILVSAIVVLGVVALALPGGVHPPATKIPDGKKN
jgi:hypothetical protein